MAFVQPGVDDLRASGSEARVVDAPCQPSAGHFGRLATGWHDVRDRYGRVGNS